jgi:hypothetical protein
LSAAKSGYFRYSEKNLIFPQITCIIPPVLPTEGRIAIVVLRGPGCGGRGSVAMRFGAWTSGAAVYDEIVWS